MKESLVQRYLSFFLQIDYNVNDKHNYTIIFIWFVSFSRFIVSLKYAREVDRGRNFSALPSRQVLLRPVSRKG